jgi:hypothetical protein
MSLLIDIRRNVSRNEVDLLNLLHTELVIATNRYDRRRWDADHRALKREKVEARLRYRHFFHAATQGV